MLDHCAPTFPCRLICSWFGIRSNEIWFPIANPPPNAAPGLRAAAAVACKKRGDQVKASRRYQVGECHLPVQLHAPTRVGCLHAAVHQNLWVQREFHMRTLTRGSIYAAASSNQTGKWFRWRVPGEEVRTCYEQGARRLAHPR